LRSSDRSSTRGALAPVRRDNFSHAYLPQRGQGFLACIRRLGGLDYFFRTHAASSAHNGRIPSCMVRLFELRDTYFALQTAHRPRNAAPGDSFNPTGIIAPSSQHRRIFVIVASS
jgi:hypothetical protein